MNRITLYLLNALALVMLCGTRLEARIINVPDGERTITRGISAADDGDTVLVQPGIYIERVDFGGKAITVASLMLMTGDETFIDSTIIDGNNSGRSVVVFTNSEDESSIIDGFTVRNSGATDYGGGIYLRESSPTVRNLIITDNNVTANGGGIYCTRTTGPTFINVRITDNSALYGGGIGIYDQSSVTLRHCHIFDNSADEAGGIYIENSDVDLDYVAVTDNESDLVGGIDIRNGCAVNLKNVTVSRNSSDQVGGIRMYTENTDNEVILLNGIVWENDNIQIQMRRDQNFNGINKLTIAYTDLTGGWEAIEATGDFSLDWLDGNIEEDPRFVSPRDRDYNLQEDSPCIDVGDPDSPNDADGSRADLGAYPTFESGILEGFVYDAYDNRGLNGADVWTSSGANTVTEWDGFWRIENAMAFDLDVSASMPGYLDSTRAGLHVGRGDTLVVDFGLLHSEFTPSIDQITEEFNPPLEPTDIEFSVENSGNGPLVWSAEKRNRGAAGVDPWVLRRSIGAGQALQDERLEGVVFIDNLFYISGANWWEGRDDTNLIYILDRDGALVDSFLQVGEAPRGMKDLAWDGELIWGAGEEEVFGFTTEGDLRVHFEGPGYSNTALTWDTDRKLLWISDITSNIVGVERTGHTQKSLDRHDLRIHGLAYWPDDPHGYNLYIFNEERETLRQVVHKMNPDDEDTMFVTYLEPPSGGSPGGAFITDRTDPFAWVFMTLSNAGPNDCIDIWQLYSNTAWLLLDTTEGELLTGQTQDFVLTLFPEPIHIRPLPDQFEGELRFKHNAAFRETFIDITAIISFDADDTPDASLPLEFGIVDIHPNPFNSATNVGYMLAETGYATLRLFDLLGREVMTLEEGVLPAGHHRVALDGSRLSAGLYICRLEAGGSASLRKMVLVK